jgi:hypothetical protein
MNIIYIFFYFIGLEASRCLFQTNARHRRPDRDPEHRPSLASGTFLLRHHLPRADRQHRERVGLLERGGRQEAAEDQRGHLVGPVRHVDGGRLVHRDRPLHFVRHSLGKRAGNRGRVQAHSVRDHPGH